MEIAMVNGVSVSMTSGEYVFNGAMAMHLMLKLWIIIEA
jgi:hypothetical protein